MESSNVFVSDASSHKSIYNFFIIYISVCIHNTPYVYLVIDPYNFKDTLSLPRYPRFYTNKIYTHNIPSDSTNNNSNLLMTKSFFLQTIGSEGVLRYGVVTWIIYMYMFACLCIGI